MKKSSGSLVIVLIVGWSIACSGGALPFVAPTDTPTAMPTLTYTPSITPTPTDTPTATPTRTPKPTRTPRPTSTPIPTRTPRPTKTPTPTDTPITTATSTNEPATATPTWTHTPATQAVTPLSQDNLISNPSFEDGSNKETADLIVPFGWRPWSSCSGTIHTELEPHPPHVRTGSFAARVWQSYNTCVMGFYQQVTVTPGKDYQLTAYGFSWSTGHPVVGSPSEANITMRIGIEPNGGTDPLANSVVWSDAKIAMDAYDSFSLIATAHHDVITVILRSVPDWGMARNDTFWDDISLLMVQR